MEVAVVLCFLQGLIVGAFCYFIAGQKNRSQESWFFLGFLFSFLALLALIAVPKIEPIEYRHSSFTPAPTPAAVIKRVNEMPATTDRVCPFCAETIKAAAKICRFCQRDVEPISAQSPASSGLGTPVSVHKPEVDWSNKDETDCSTALKEVGFDVAFSAPSKWHITSASGKSTSYAYSLKDLRRIAERETTK